jgi:hypothetical protein
MQEARYALLQAKAHLEHWRQRGKRPSAVWHARFYAADVSLRLYSGGEHFAEGIVAMLEIENADLKPFKKGVTSRQAAVGKYMLSQRASHAITLILSTLDDSPDWKSAISYRNLWVHQQAPSVEGLGTTWNRQTRWRALPAGGQALNVGGGDPPVTTIDAVLESMELAFDLYVQSLEQLVAHYRLILEQAGWQITQNGGSLEL